MRRLAFLGPLGTFSEAAALNYDPDAKKIPLISISAVARAVDSGEADEGVLPVENSLEGSVTETLDLLINDSKLMICNELVLPIEHYLLVRPGMQASEVAAVYSHPQALAQCRSFLEQSFPKAQSVAAISTAAAVEEMMSQKGAAAIGNRRTAELFGAEVLASGLTERQNNLTRFVVVAGEDHKPTGRDKTSLAFTFAVEDRPGQLVTTLEEFAVRDINLSKVESRPSKERLGAYVFLVDVGGHRHDQHLASALETVQGMCSTFRILGSYPRYQEKE